MVSWRLRFAWVLTAAAMCTEQYVEHHSGINILRKEWTAPGWSLFTTVMRIRAYSRYATTNSSCSLYSFSVLYPSCLFSLFNLLMMDAVRGVA